VTPCIICVCATRILRRELHSSGLEQGLYQDLLDSVPAVPIKDDELVNIRFSRRTLPHEVGNHLSIVFFLGVTRGISCFSASDEHSKTVRIRL